MVNSIVRAVLAGGAVWVALAIPAAAQVKTSESVEHGTPTTQVTVQRGTVVYVSGNDVVIQAEDGQLHDFNNVPDSVTVSVDGQQLNVHQLKPGMKVERQTITTTTPRTVTKVETVTGKVFRVNAPRSVILTLENGQNQSFNIPKGQKFSINGKETDAFGLRPGMTVTAQKVTEVPETVVTEEVKRTGTMPPPPPPPQAGIPVLIVMVPAAPAPVETASAAEPAHEHLPKTASELPLVALLGALCCAVALAAMGIRRFKF